MCNTKHFAFFSVFFIVYSDRLRYLLVDFKELDVRLFGREQHYECRTSVADARSSTAPMHEVAAVEYDKVK